VEPWLIWLIVGAALTLLELVVPGGIVIFLGISAVAVALGVRFGHLPHFGASLMAWLGLSVVLLFTLRSLFMKYFEGDSTVQNVDESADYLNAMVEVIEAVHPYKEGRVSFRGSTWQARSDEEIAQGTTAVIIGRDGNTWIIKTL
jgi:membrane protein implicated in regulation of membrane protease activity